MKRKLISFGHHIFQLFRKRKKKPFIYVAIGDSTVEGVGATAGEKSFAGRIFSFLREHREQVEYYNFGKAFATVKDVITFQLPKVLDKNPDLVVIAVGANDIQCHTSQRKFDKQYSKLLVTLKQKTHAVIIVNTIPDVSSLHIVPRLAKLYCKWLVQRFNNRISQHAEKTGASVVDAYKRSNDLKKIYSNYKELLFVDGVHPSDKGYALWADTIIQQIYPFVL